MQATINQALRFLLDSRTGFCSFTPQAKMSSRKPTMRCPKHSILCHQLLRPPTTTHKNSSQFRGSQPGAHGPLGVRLLICRGTF